MDKKFDWNSLPLKVLRGFKYCPYCGNLLSKDSSEGDSDDVGSCYEHTDVYCRNPKCNKIKFITYTEDEESE